MKRWWCLGALLALVACDEGGQEKAVDLGGAEDAVEDTGRDVDQDLAGPDLPGEDVGGDAGQDLGEDLWETPALTQIEVEAQGTRVLLGFSPFVLEVRDRAGQLVAQGARSGDATFSGISVGVTDRFNPSIYYEPSLEQARRGGGEVTWYQVDRLRSGEAVGAGARFVASTLSGEGERGPDVELRVMPGPQGVVLELDLLGEQAAVYTNLNLEARPQEGFYGFGEVFDRLDSRGVMREMQVQARGDSESAVNEVHVPVPLVLSTHGYGLFLEDRYPAAIDPARLREDVLRVTTLSPLSRWHFMTAPSPMELVERYTDLTGKPAHVPFWALAPQFWRNVNRDQAEVLEDARRAREMGVPTTVLWIDRPWSSYYHNWRFAADRFPDPEAMAQELEAMGYRLLLHHSPQLNPPGASDLGAAEDSSEGLYQTFLDNDWLVRLTGAGAFEFPWGGGRGGFIDWSHPGAVAEVQGQIPRVTALGAIGTKMDWDEYLQPNVGELRLSLSFHNGETNLTMKTWYSALYHKAIIEGFDQALGEPSFHVSRSGAPGDQVWNTCIWPGDLDNDFSEHTRGPSQLQEAWNVGGMPSAIVANQSLGMSGYPCFASDIGGYRGGAPEEEVLLRWVAFGVFNAVTQIGGGGTTHMAWSSDTPYSERALEITRKFFALRMELVPYVFHYLWRAHQSGRPLVRSLWLQFPEDAQSRAHERDFMFGPDVLVAPVYEAGAVERSLYLPQGHQWVDFWSGERLEGGQVVTRAAGLDTIPVFLRAGAVVPMAEPGVDTLMPAQAEGVVSYQERRRMRLLLAPGPERQVSLYNGLQVTSARVEGDDVRVTVEQGLPEPGLDERFGFVPQGVTLEVTAAGTSFEGGLAQVSVAREGAQAQVLPKSEEAGCQDCWRYEEERGRLVVILSGPGAVLLEAAQ